MAVITILLDHGAELVYMERVLDRPPRVAGRRGNPGFDAVEGALMEVRDPAYVHFPHHRQRYFNIIRLFESRLGIDGCWPNKQWRRLRLDAFNIQYDNKAKKNDIIALIRQDLEQNNWSLYDEEMEKPNTGGGGGGAADDNMGAKNTGNDGNKGGGGRISRKQHKRGKKKSRKKRRKSRKKTKKRKRKRKKRRLSKRRR